MANTKKATDIKKNIASKLARYFGTTPAEANREQLYKATALTVKDILTEKRRAFKTEVNETGKKRVYYMCMEFLLGRSLKTNINNLGLSAEYKKALASFGADLDELYEEEPDAGLGNGGLGRLAACFMDSLASLDYPATGFSICYEYGLFRQKIIDGMQVELPDVWLPGGEVWLVPRTDSTFHVRFGGHVKELWQNGKLEISHTDYEEVEAVPYDMMISGASEKGVARLRLWRARDIRNFNMGLFTQGQYTKALEESTNAEIISKVLYPSDNHTEGKLLRLSQQYFLVCASLQSIIRDHMSVYGRLDNLADKVAIHINDTHPALCVPELMRILMDEHGWDWDKAWNTVVRVCSYTNHTVMPEALETWNEDLFRLKLPRIHNIVKEINERFCKTAWETFPSDWQKISSMSIIANNQVRMANLSIVGSHSVNGVSALHSDILKKSTFRDFYKMYPDRFTNVTNGIAHRRWLCYSNPLLSELITELIGDGFKLDPAELSKLREFEGDKAVLDRLAEIKRKNKVSFANHMAKRGIVIDPNSLFDVQIKRLHEYKRQLLNALNIIRIYLDIKNDPSIDIQPQTFIFGAKAAPGYYMAKEIIKLLCFISKDIESHPEIREKLRVVFLEDYNVSTAEALIPSAEISEQISLAGKEASGTGCMKLMMNGALTLGTYDGANVEMVAETGNENMFIFGLRCNEVDELWSKGYRAQDYYANNERLAEVIDYLQTGFAGESFANIRSYLIAGSGISDPYMCLADFESYREAHQKALRTYADRDKWNTMSLINIAASGKFAADRSIEEYAKNIWGIERLK
ncbi:MAG: glycogen/starch/alpha-glucan phosphorylase [Clostridia bacterium]|nr:glycogen/starch/alpha-glucan phosphorylase [Clostridia bacterium]